MKSTKLVSPSYTLNLITNFTAVHTLTGEQLDRILTYINNPSWWDSLSQIFKQNISDLITSIRAYPFDIINTMQLHNSFGQLFLGGQGINNEDNTSMIVPYITDFNIKEMKVSLGTIEIPKIHSSYRDYFNKYTLYLPYLESIELDSEECTPKSDEEAVNLSIEYVINLLTGEVTCYVMKHYTNSDGNEDERVINIVNGSIGVDIPISSSNKNEIATKLICDSVRAIITKGTSLLSMDIPVVNYTQVGKFSDGLGKMFGCQHPYLKIESDIISTNNLYLKLNGKPLNQTKGLYSLKGYTELQDIRLEDVANITSEERDELYGLLTTGVYF